MSQGLFGSICLEDLFDGTIGKSQDGSMWVNLSNLTGSHFQTSPKNGKHYVNIVQYINDEPDQFQNISSIQHSVTKEEKAAGKKGKFIGNMKFMQQQQHAPYNPNPSQAPGNYPQGQQWGQQPGQAPGGFSAPGSFQQPPAGPPPGNFPPANNFPPAGNSYGPPPGPQYGPQPGTPQQYPAQQPQAPQQPQNNPGGQYNQQGHWVPNPGPGPQPVTQQMISEANRQQPQGPPQFGTPPQGAWTPAVSDLNGPLPF